ncbi:MULTISPECIES: hypothetical protein [unclassified Nocardiopsis]|uniref:hypothetical protein n=1 Tax=unclassified Nocardiopsis TaxID=2649073 RepID=UPI00135AFF4A|nr:MULTISPECIES: hypothetical protein [unclassified Nocardiopsis]
MYGLIWRILPGPWASKFIMAVGLLAGAAALLWFFAFPAISPYMPFNDGAVDVQGAGTGAETGAETGEDGLRDGTGPAEDEGVSEEQGFEEPAEEGRG